MGEFRFSALRLGRAVEVIVAEFLYCWLGLARNEIWDNDKM